MQPATSNRLSTKEMAYIALFAIIIAMCSWITVPAVVPFTMQTFGVFMALGVLGGRRGTFAVGVYLLMGIFGLPVFSNFTGGIGHLFDATGGYIFGFLLSALVVWALEKPLSKRSAGLAISMVIGLIGCYLLGTVWFVMVYTGNTGEIGWISALVICVFPYIIPDGIKIALALTLSKRLRKLIQLP